MALLQTEELIAGSVERVTFHNEENGYCVLRIKSKSQRDLITIVGHTASVTAGEFVEALGSWTNHREFGVQFHAQTLNTVHPSTKEGIMRYLGSGMIKGIGPHIARSLVDHFGVDIFDVIERTPELLSRVHGIGPLRLEMITKAWDEQKAIREIMVFLQSHGVGTSRAVRIYKTYGQQAIAKVKKNPYQLARDIAGIGFKSADQIASHLGIETNSPLRARAGINHALMEQVGNGHCAYPEEELLEQATELLSIDREILKQALNEEIDDKFLVREQIEQTHVIYPAAIHHCERRTAEGLKALAIELPAWGKIDSAKAIEWVEPRLGITLAELQKQAISQALESKVFVITGGPGTGKTTITRAIVEILRAKNIELLLCSPTGRAAKRLSECTGLEAKTIHRLLRVDPKARGFLHNRDNPLECDLLLVDETSMVDISLMYNLLKAVPNHAALILVGDADQIPSVGPGAVLKSILESNAINSIRLTQIYRQASQSQIITAAHRINRGMMPESYSGEPNSDFYFISCDEPQDIASKITELVSTRLPSHFGFDRTRDIQVLCPMNRGGSGARSLNVELQKALNPNPAVFVDRFGSRFAPNDKVLVTANDYDKEVFNGDIGIITQVDPEHRRLVVDIDGRDVEFDFSELDLLSLAYAITIHKAQGSEYPAVVIPVTMQHFMMLKRNLLYTAVTRGKKLVVLVGQKKAIAIAVKDLNRSKRWTRLAERLSGI